MLIYRPVKQQPVNIAFGAPAHFKCAC